MRTSKVDERRDRQIIEASFQQHYCSSMTSAGEQETPFEISRRSYFAGASLILFLVLANSDSEETVTTLDCLMAETSGHMGGTRPS